MSQNTNAAKPPVSPVKKSSRRPKWDRFIKERASFELDLETLLLAKEKELAKAQAEIKGECAAPDERADIEKRGFCLSSLTLVCSQNCRGKCSRWGKPAARVRCLYGQDYGSEDPSFKFDF